MIPGIVAGRAVASGGGGGDPYWTDVVSLVHFDGADGSTVFTDQKGLIWTPSGGANIDTGRSKFGSGSLRLEGSTDYIGSPTLDLGSAWTIEFWLWRETTAFSFPFNVGAGTPATFLEFKSGAANLDWTVGGSDQSVVTGGAPTGEWVHYALVQDGIDRAGIFIGGVLAAKNSTINPQAINAPLFFGGRTNNTSRLRGWIDEIRITSGVARYTANFTPPIAPFPDS